MKIYKDIAVRHGAEIIDKEDNRMIAVVLAQYDGLLVFTDNQLASYSRELLERAIHFKPYTYGAFDMSHEDAEAMQ